MTERQKQMIADYLPNPRDPELGPFDYYVLDNAMRVQKVHVTDIYPNKDDLYHIVYTDSGRQVKSWLDGYGGFPLGFLYDNKEDCRAMTHSWYSGWEELRRLQEEEA